MLILLLINGFHNGLRAVLLRSWQRIARSYAPQWLSQRFAPRIAKQLAADYSFLHSSTAFTKVCTPYCSADSSGLLVLMLVNGFYDHLGAVLLSSWQRIARSYARQLLLRFAQRIEQWMAAHCKYFHSSMAFTTVCAPHCSADGRALLILSFGIGFHGLRAIFLSGWQRIAHTSTRYRLLRRFARTFVMQLAADCSFIRSSKPSTTVCAPYCLADGNGLLILPIVNVFHASLRAVLLSGWQRIARSYTRQWLSRVAPHFSQRMAAHCSSFHSAWACTVCMLYCSADGSTVLILPYVNGFHNGLRPISLILTVVYDFSDISRAVLLDGLHNILTVGVALSSACR